MTLNGVAHCVKVHVRYLISWRVLVTFLVLAYPGCPEKEAWKESVYAVVEELIKQFMCLTVAKTHQSVGNILSIAAMCLFHF